MCEEVQKLSWAQGLGARVGEEVYSNGKNPFGVKGQMLHAKSLEFKHPITGNIMKLEAPIPEYFEEVLKKLDNE